MTFSIVTYRRPAEVRRLLELFLNPAWERVRSQLDFQIVVADDHGMDDGFRQGSQGEMSNEPGNSVRVVTDLEEPVHYRAKASETSAYPAKRAVAPALDALTVSGIAPSVFLRLLIYLTKTSTN